MQDFTISRRAGFEYLGEIKVQISAPLGTAHGVMLGLAVVAALQGGANLQSADLRYADLQSANLQSADLRYADLRYADLRYANLQSADLQSAKNPEEALFGGFQIPQEGQLIVWKKLSNGYLAKLQIPAKAGRTATPIGRKCRAEWAKVVAIYCRDGTKLDKSSQIPSQHDAGFMYAGGAVVTPRKAYDASPWVECTSGIHFFLTREEAAAY